jgi:PhnB protein
MSHSVQPIPKGFHSVTPYLVVNDAARAIDFYKRAFGAQESMRMETPGGKIGHAELRIGDSIVMLSDEMPGSGARSPGSLGGCSAGVFLYVENVDTAFKNAISAGAKAEAEPTDVFWGDRYGRLTDPFGCQWSLATHKVDLAPAELAKCSKEAIAKTTSRVQPVS